MLHAEILRLILISHALVYVIKCPNESVLINVILPHSICIEFPPQLRGRQINIDGKQVDFNDMIIVIVKCFNYNWMTGSESD